MVFSFFERARPHYEHLGLTIKPTAEETDSEFLKKIGCGAKSHKNWYSTGIKPIYHRLLDYVIEAHEAKEETIKLREENKELKQKLELKKPI